MRVLSTIRLSETQKIVMARVLNAPNPYVAYDNINEGTNLVSAAKELTSIGLMTYNQGQAEITDEGQTVLQNENIVDESGELTEDGQQYATMKGPSEKGKEAEPPQPTDTSAPQGGEEAPPGGDMGMGGDEEMQMSSFNLLYHINDGILLKEELGRLKK